MDMGSRQSQAQQEKNWIANAELARSFRATELPLSPLNAERALELRETAFPPFQLNWERRVGFLASRGGVFADGGDGLKSGNSA